MRKALTTILAGTFLAGSLFISGAKNLEAQVINKTSISQGNTSLLYLGNLSKEELERYKKSSKEMQSVFFRNDEVPNGYKVHTAWCQYHEKDKKEGYDSKELLVLEFNNDPQYFEIVKKSKKYYHGEKREKIPRIDIYISYRRYWDNQQFEKAVKRYKETQKTHWDGYIGGSFKYYIYYMNREKNIILAVQFLGVNKENKTKEALDGFEKYLRRLENEIGLINFGLDYP